MIRLQKRRKGPYLGIWLFLLLGVLAFSLVSCDSLFGPSEEEEEEEEEGEIARIIISNLYGEALDIYMDGTFQFLLENEDEEKIRDVSHEEHLLEAKRQGTNELVDSEEIDVVSDVDYSWTIDDHPDINVTNSYGETLKIYMDGNYQFDLVDEENRWIIDVAFGERFLKALRASDDKEIASTTIDIEKNQDYSWVIQ